MPSNPSFDNEFLNTAVKHRLLSADQASELLEESRSSGASVRELAIRKGIFNGRKLDMLTALESPLKVAPGFRVESILGVGGFGIVFKATQLNLDRIVALKTIHLAELSDATAHQRFEREAKIVGQFRHPNIVAAYDFGLHDDRLYLSMEYVQGLDVDRTLERRGPFDEITTWQIIRQVSMALAYAAEHGVIHRDIKPGNLMLTEAPVGYSLPDDIPLVKVADFGLACFNENHLQNNRITVAESAVGTPYYMAPEQLIADEVDQRADIYSLGVTAWQMLTGHPPMHGDAPVSIITKKTRGDDSWLDDPAIPVSPTSVDLIRNMCAHDRAQRVENHPRLLTRIDQALKSLATGANENRALSQRSDPSPQAPESLVPITEISRTEQDTGPANSNLVTSGNGPESPSGQVSAHRRYLPGLVIAFLIFIVLLIAVLSFPVDNDSAVASHQEQTLVELAGPPHYFFNGMSVDPRQTTSGTWENAEGLEKGSVLAGYGSRDFECIGLDGQPLLYFRFGCGFLHHQSETMSFHLRTLQKGELGHVEIQRNQAIFRQNVDVDGPIEIGRHPLRQFGETSQGYHQIRLERHVNFWVAYLDGHTLGKIHCQDESPATIELMVVGPGNAHFEQIRVTPFKR